MDPHPRKDSEGSALLKDLFAGVSAVVYGSEEERIEIGTETTPEATRIDYRGSMLGTVDVPIFQCPDDGERKIVYYYDPAHPPRCSQNHVMQPATDVE
jgi:hypothetical protein